MRALRLPRSLYDELVAHAREDAPNECCGMIASVDGRALAVHRARNEAASPFKYIVHPKDLYSILDAMEDAGHDLVIYHSHTRSAPEPSQTDVNLAFLPGTKTVAYPGALYLIIGIQHDEPELRLWSIDLDGVAEVDLIVE